MRSNVLVSTSFDEEVLDDDADDLCLRPKEVGVWSLTKSNWTTRAMLGERTGTLMPVDGHFVGFYGHPRLFRTDKGRVVASWDDLSSGAQTSSILSDTELPPPLALDPPRRRFAVATTEGVTVVQLG